MTVMIGSIVGATTLQVDLAKPVIAGLSTRKSSSTNSDTVAEMWTN